jgi:hypothetical protein
VFSNANSRNLQNLLRACDRVLLGAWLDVHDPLSTLQELWGDIKKHFRESGFV